MTRTQVFVNRPLVARTRSHCTLVASSSSKNNSPSSSFSSNSVNNNKSSVKILSKTARESAILVEWEPVTELKRRIDEGIHYEHESSYKNVASSTSDNNFQSVEGAQSSKKNPSLRKDQVSQDRMGMDSPIPAVLWSFVATEEELTRLKSAHPEDFENKFESSNMHGMGI